MASIDRRASSAGDVRWRVRWREYPHGPQHAKHFTLKKDAEAFRDEIGVSLRHGTYVSPEQQRITFSQYAEQHVARQVWRPRTVDLAQRALGHWATIFGGARPLSAIRKSDVERGIVRLSKVMAPTTVRVQFQHLRTLMRAAMADQVIRVDPTIGVRLPAKGSGELAIPTPEIVRTLLDAAPAHFRAAIILGAHVGLRAGEAQGLLVDDVDFLRRVVSVRRQLAGKPALELREPKTAASVRSVPVPSMVLDELGRHVEAFGPGPQGVLLHHDNAFLHDNAFNHTWRRTQHAAGITAGTWRFHSLRHAFASSLISAGCSVKAVADAMGHESPTTTLRTYASLWPGDEDRVRSAIAAAWTAEDSLRTGDHQIGS